MTVLPEFHDQLHAAASRHARRRLPRPGAHVPRWPEGVVFIGLSTVVAIAVAVIVLSAGAGGSAGPVASRPSSIERTRTELLGTFAVLRAPADAASRRAIACAATPRQPTIQWFRTCRISATFRLFGLAAQSSQMSAQSGYARFDRALIRVVPLPRFDATVAFIPTTWRPSPRSHRRTEGLVITIAYPRGSTNTGPTPTSVETVRTHGLAVSGGNATPQMRSVYGAVVVPDGVATVTLHPIRLLAPPATVNPRRFGTVTTSVHDNVAGFRFAVPTVTDRRAKSSVYAVTLLARAIWSDQHGNVIARTTTQLPLWLRVHGDNGPITSTN